MHSSHAPSQPKPLGYSVPTRISIPRINVSAPVIELGLDKHGSLGVPPPTNRNLAGWYAQAASPGELGTAVIDGHVDTRRGPAVFYGLGALHRGDAVDVLRKDGRTAVFTVYGVQLFAKNNFPSERVYGPTGQPELRLITCGGGFTRKRGYDGNVVVFARLSRVR